LTANVDMFKEYLEHMQQSLNGGADSAGATSTGGMDAHQSDWARRLAEMASVVQQQQLQQQARQATPVSMVTTNGQ
jgi:hypothetical protein